MDEKRLNKNTSPWLKSKYDLFVQFVQKYTLHSIVMMFSLIMMQQIKSHEMKAVIERQDILIEHLVKRQDSITDRQDKLENEDDILHDATYKNAQAIETISKVVAINFQWNNEQDSRQHLLEGKLLGIENTQDTDRKDLIKTSNELVNELKVSNKNIESLLLTRSSRNIIESK